MDGLKTQSDLPKKGLRHNKHSSAVPGAFDSNSNVPQSATTVRRGLAATMAHYQAKVEAYHAANVGAESNLASLNQSNTMKQLRGLQKNRPIEGSDEHQQEPNIRWSSTLRGLAKNRRGSTHTSHHHERAHPAVNNQGNRDKDIVVGADGDLVGAYFVASPPPLPNQQNLNGHPVDDPTQQDDANEIHDSNTTVKWYQQRSSILAVVAVALILVVMIAVATPWVLKMGGTEDDSPSNLGNQEGEATLEDPLGNQEGEATLEDPTEEGFDLSLVPGLPNSTILALKDTFSPQYLAFDWISKDPNWNDYDDWRKQQRFAMACFDFARGRGSLNYNIDECDWIFLADEPCPQNDGVVREIHGSIYAGQLPPEIVLLSNLEVVLVSFGYNVGSLESMFPVDVALQLPLMRKITVSHVELKGAVPSSFGLFTMLTYLDLSDNGLSSTIPTELGLLSNLTTLDLTDNDLSGTIPEELGSLSFLTTFRVDANPKMKSPVPSGFCTEEHADWKTLETDWCTGSEQCCSDI